MQRTVQLRLDVSPEQDAILTATLAASRSCFNAVAEHGWTAREKNGVELHKATYRPLREAHPTLPSQLVISARMKATEALRSAFTKLGKGEKATCPRSERGSVRYDARSYRMEPQSGGVGLSTVAGRLKFPYHAMAHGRRWLDRASGFDSAELIHRPSGWWLHVVVTVDPPEVEPTGKVVGVDLGITRPAVTSEGLFLGDRRWKEIENRYFRLRRKLQAKGTPSAKRHLKKMSRRQRLFRRDCDHVLSKAIVRSVEPGSVIAVENLTGIRSRTKQRGRRQRRRHHGWSYARLRAFLTYKTEETGCIVAAVDPRKTSQRCNRCGHEHRRNRPTQSVFRCLCCGYELNADLNAAINVAWKYHAEVGMSDLGGRLVNAPIVGDVDHAFTSAHKPPYGTGRPLTRKAIVDPPAGGYEGGRRLPTRGSTAPATPVSAVADESTPASASGPWRRPESSVAAT